MAFCSIKYTNNSQNQTGIFYSGQLINGIVELSLSQPASYRGLRLTVSGTANCEWSENVDEYDHLEKRHRSRTVRFHAQENYLRNVTFAFGSQNGEPVDMQPGFYTFNFSNLLPLNIPSSFEGQGAKISYEVEAVFIRPWKITDLKAKAALKVITVHDLNMNPMLRVPSNAEVVKTFCCWFCKSEPLIMSVTIPFSGYVSGQQMEVIIDVHNKSDKDVNRVVIQLVQITKLTSQHPRSKTKIDSKVVLETAHNDGVIKCTNEQIQKILIIPQLTPIKHSTIIDVSFELRIVGEVSGAINPKLSIPFEIGTVQLGANNFVVVEDTSAPAYGEHSGFNAPPSYNQTMGFVPDTNPNYKASAPTEIVIHPSAPQIDFNMKSSLVDNQFL